jgi:hypothetical protein
VAFEEYAAMETGFVCPVVTCRPTCDVHQQWPPPTLVEKRLTEAIFQEDEEMNPGFANSGFFPFLPH